MINIYEYLDYRKFLQDFYLCKKKDNPSFSYGVFAKNAGISSRGLVKLIIDGKRNISLKTLPKMVKGLKLNKTEEKYFFTLVRFSQSSNLEEKNNLYQRLFSFAGRKKVHTLCKEQYKIYAEWYYTTIYEMMNLKDCPSIEENLYRWISKKLFGEITYKQAEEAILDLVKVGLLVPSEDKFVQEHNLISHPGGKINIAIQMFQKRMIEKSNFAFQHPLEQRNISSVTLAIKEKDTLEAKKFIDEFINNFNYKFSSKENADYIYQLNIQFFELTDRNFIFSEKSRPDAKNLNSAKLQHTEILN